VKKCLFIICIISFAVGLLLGIGVSWAELHGSEYAVTIPSDGHWYAGYAEAEIPLPDSPDEVYYIAGYKNGVTPDGIADPQMAHAVWLDNGSDGILLISVDCVGLTSDTVGQIRGRLADFAKKAHCVSIQVCSTHTHAGVDTMGLWGKIAIDGKNDTFMQNLISAAVQSAKAAYESRTVGTLGYAASETDIQYDSRRPEVYDTLLHQIRFTSDTSSNTIRILIYAAHAESLRGANNTLSADYPGRLAEIIREKTGDNVLFLNDGIGGLIMTKELVEPFDAFANMNKTAEILADTALSMKPENDRTLSAEMKIVRTNFTVPMENTLFLYYRFLGILGSDVSHTLNGYRITTSLHLLSLGDVTLSLLPGEIFPELIYGGAVDVVASGRTNPTPLLEIAESFGIHTLITVGLANDEIGYIIPPSDWLLSESLPYFDTVKDSTGENHYEETNSTGIEAAIRLADAFRKAISKLK